MRHIRDLPIKRKLVIIIMVVTTAALLLAGLGIILADSILFRRSLQRDLNSLAQIIADNSTAALAFNDPKSAGETLNALRTRTHLIAACTLRLDGTVLAEYSRDGASSACTSDARENDFRLGAREVAVSRAVVLSGQTMGKLVLRYDLKEISERMNLYGASVLALIWFSWISAFFLSSSLSALIADPVSELVRAATTVSETNDYGVRVKRISGDELGVLAHQFNNMLGGIQSRDTSLRKALLDREYALRAAETARERFRFMAESMPQKIFTATPLGEMDYCNLQWTEFSGLPFEQMKAWGGQLLHPDDRDANTQAWQHSVESGAPFHFQHRFRRADGVYRWHLTRAHAMRDAAGEITMWIGSNTDIHEQKEKEEELRRANEDLQQFAYAASHDLQEPVRNVAVYSELVGMKYKDKLDGEGQLFLGFLVEGGRRLATLINDLLTYTRVGMVEDNVTPVDASAVLQDTLSSLSEAIRESHATITYDPLPKVFMGEAHLQQVFLNLIGNALKYSKDNPRVHISAVRYGGGAWLFSVQDNGIGIDPQYKEKIFGVFKRLHRDERYTGTGIGLAICQRVVERYGGRIWVESESENGATFFFTIQHDPRTDSETPASIAG